MDSSNHLNIKQVNQEIIHTFQKKKATDLQHAVYIENLEIPYSRKIIYYLIEEFVRNDFMIVLEDGKVYFNEKKYAFEKKKVQIIYISILIIPFIIGGLLMIL